MATASYAYDAAGQRIESVITDGCTTTTTSYTFEGLTLLSLRAASDRSESWRIDYLYDEEGRPYAGTYRSPASSTDPTLFVMITTDRGDVVELLDEDGDAFAAYRYDEWGNPLSSATQSTNNLSAQLAAQVAERQILRYAGYVWDDESGLYYCSARHYDPYSRQFISKDPAKADGEESAYQYCGGEPVGHVDRSGHKRHRTVVKSNGPVYCDRCPRWKVVLDGYVWWVSSRRGSRMFNKVTGVEAYIRYEPEEFTDEDAGNPAANGAAIVIVTITDSTRNVVVWHRQWFDIPLIDSRYADPPPRQIRSGHTKISWTLVGEFGGRSHLLGSVGQRSYTF